MWVCIVRSCARGVGIYSDDIAVEVGHGGRQTGHAMFSSLIGLDVVAGVSPVKSNDEEGL